MRQRSWIFGLLLCLVAVPALAARGAGGAKRAPGADGPDIAAEAAAPLTAMCTFLKSQKSFSFTARVESEEVYPNGQTIQVSRNVSTLVVRPDKVISRVVGDDRDRLFLYDGKTVTVADYDRGVYAVMDAPPTLDATVTMLEDKYGLHAPLGDLLYADPCAVLLPHVRTGDCVGVHQAGGVACDHLAFTQKSADWQLWVEKDKTPLPRKLVITDKTLMGWPQYAVTFTKWDLTPQVPAGLFIFKPAADMRRIEFLPMVSGQGAKK